MAIRIYRERMLCGALMVLVLLMALPGVGQAADVKLAWDANSERDLAGYNIYYGSVAGGPYDGMESSEGQSPIVIPLDDLDDPANPVSSFPGLKTGPTILLPQRMIQMGLRAAFRMKWECRSWGEM